MIDQFYPGSEVIKAGAMFGDGTAGGAFAETDISYSTADLYQDKRFMQYALSLAYHDMIHAGYDLDTIRRITVEVRIDETNDYLKTRFYWNGIRRIGETGYQIGSLTIGPQYEKENSNQTNNE